MPDLDEQAVSPFASSANLPIDKMVANVTTDYGVDVPKLKSSLSGIGKQEAAASEGAANRQLAAQTSNYESLKSKAASVTSVNVKPWNADQERADRIRSPLEDFGSYGSVFAMLASALTHTPMDNALNAGAAAINSARANDLDGYNKAYDAHKENLNLALKIHESQRQDFKDAEELYKQDPIAGGAELKAVAAKYGAKAQLAFIDAGLIPKAFEIQKSQNEAFEGLLKTQPELDKMHQETRTVLLQKRAIDEENQKRQQSGMPPLNSQEQAQIAGDVKRSLTAAFQTGSKADEYALEQQVKALRKDHPELSEFEARTQLQQQRKDATANAATREKMGSIERAKADWLDLHPEANGVVPPEVENSIRAKASARAIASAEPSLTDKASQLIAERLLAGDRAALTGLGYGAVGAANRAKALNDMTEMAAARGIDGGALARQAIEYSATGRGAASLAQLEARTTGAITKAQSTAPRVLEISDKIDRTKFPSINSIILAAQKGAGGENVVRLGIAVETFINNYALALGAGNSAMTDSSKQHARELLEKSYSKGQMNAAIDQMLIEMDSELGGIKRGMKQYLAPERAASAPSAEPDPIHVNTPEEAHTYPSGTKIIMPDGSTGVVP